MTNQFKFDSNSGAFPVLSCAWSLTTASHDEPEKRIDLFRALAVGQLEESNLKQQCSCDGEQDRDDRSPRRYSPPLRRCERVGDPLRRRL